MSDKFERFTKRARRVLTLAQEEAQRLNHNYIGTEHLLLGLVREENSDAYQVLQEFGLNLQQVIRAVERTVGRGERTPFGKPALAPRTKHVIELAVDEARQSGAGYLGTGDLLVGLIHEGDGIAANVLRGFGVSLDRVRAVLQHSAAAGLHKDSDAVSSQQTFQTFEREMASLAAILAGLPLSPATKRALELAVNLATARGYTSINTGLLLFGLTGLEEGIAPDVLRSLGDLERVRTEIMRRFASGQDDE